MQVVSNRRYLRGSALSMSLHRSGGSSSNLNDPTSLDEVGEKRRSVIVVGGRDASVCVANWDKHGPCVKLATI